MTWPTSAIAQNSAAAVWAYLCDQATFARGEAMSARIKAERGTLTPDDLRKLLPRIRVARTAQADFDGTAGLQTYARLALSNPAFDLSVETAALKTAYAGVVQEGRALHNLAAGSIAADGTVTEPLTTIPAATAAAFIAACQALEAAVG